MTDDEIPREMSLWKCTIKKSWHVTTTLLDYLVKSIAGCIIIGGIIAGVFILYVAVMNISPLLSIIYGTSVGAFYGAIGLFYILPWWAYAIIIVIMAIPVYSFAWCLNRDMTPDDKKVDPTNPKTMTCMVIGLIIGGIKGGYNGWYIGYNLIATPTIAGFMGAMGAICGGIILGFIGAIIGSLIGDLYVVSSQYYIRKKGEPNDKSQNEQE